MAYDKTQIVTSSKPTFGDLPNHLPCGTLRRMKKAATEHEIIGGRIKAVRLAFSDLDQKAWAEKHTFNRVQYGSWERGNRRIPLEASEKLCEIYGLSLDWIYRGRRDGLSENAAKVL